MIVLPFLSRFAQVRHEQIMRKNFEQKLSEIQESAQKLKEQTKKFQIQRGDSLEDIAKRINDQIQEGKKKK